MLILISCICTGQNDFSRIDQYAKEIPDSLLTQKSITDYLVEGMTDDMQKTRAFYVWIAHNITYDYSQYSIEKRYNSKQDILDEVLMVRSGVCQHYSELFHALCKQAGIRSWVISGYARLDNGQLSDIGHAWNAVYINEHFYFIDATWASGYMTEGRYRHEFTDKYFMIEPEKFIKTHMPFDPVWQFLDHPLNHRDFIDQDFSKLNVGDPYDFKEQLMIIEHNDPISNLELENRRITECGVENNLIRRQLNENKLQLTNLKYNAAIDTLNQGINSYNLYITYKNRQFRDPKIEDEQILTLIDQAKQGIYAADLMLSTLHSDDAAMKDLIRYAKKKMPEMIRTVEQEAAFVDRYLKKRKPFRIFMFYSYSG